MLKRLLKIVIFFLPFYLYNNLVEASLLFGISVLITQYESIGKQIQRLKLRDFIFFLYLFHMLFGERDFAYVGFEPIFITEITIATLTMLYWKELLYLKKGLSPYYLMVSLGLVYGIIYFFQHQISALRDSLMLVYAIWVPIVYVVFRKRDKFELFFDLFKIFIVTKTFMYIYEITLIVLGIKDPLFEGFRFGVGYIIPPLLILALVVPVQFLNKKYKFMALVMLMSVFTTFHRSIFLGVACAVAFFFFFGNKKIQNFILRYGTLGGVALVLFVIYYNSQVEVDLFHIIGQKFTLQEGNVRYRLISWGEVLKQFSDSWLLGYGVGKPLFFERGNFFYDVANLSYFQIRDIGGNAQPHNSYLNILARFGIIFYPIFLAGIVKPFEKVRELSRLMKRDRTAFYRLLLLFGFMINMYVFAFFNVVLESPHHGFPYWLSVSLVLAYTRLVYTNKDLPERRVKLVKKETKVNGGGE